MPRKRKFDCSVHEIRESSRGRASRRVSNLMNFLPPDTLLFPTYFDDGDCEYICEYCSALFWFAERIVGGPRHAPLRCTRCCRGGAVRLPLPIYPPAVIRDLFQDACFLENIRAYNNMFPIRMITVDFPPLRSPFFAIPLIRVTSTFVCLKMLLNESISADFLLQEHQLFYSMNDFLRLSATVALGHRNIKGLNRYFEGAITLSNLFDPEDDIDFNFNYTHPYFDGIDN